MGKIHQNHEPRNHSIRIPRGVSTGEISKFRKSIFLVELSVPADLLKLKFWRIKFLSTLWSSFWILGHPCSSLGIKPCTCENWNTDPGSSHVFQDNKKTARRFEKDATKVQEFPQDTFNLEGFLSSARIRALSSTTSSFLPFCPPSIFEYFQ